VVKARGKKRWRLRLYLGINPKSGKQEWFSGTYDTKKEAELQEAKLKVRKGNGLGVLPSKEPFDDFLERWLDDVKRPEISPGTLADYRGLIDRFIIRAREGVPHLGPIPLSRLRTDDFQGLYSALWESGLGCSSLKYLHRTLRQALSYAVRTGTLHRNPTDHVKPPSRPRDGEEQKPLRVMTEGQAKAFLEAAREDRLHALWVLLVTCGLRPSEALGLLWEDVDLEAATIHIQRSLSRRGIQGWRLGPTKTRGSRRVIDLPEPTLRALKAHRARQNEERLLLGKEWQDHGFVFANQVGNPYESRNVLHQNFRRVCKRAGLGSYGERPPKPRSGPWAKAPFKPDFDLYSLRHTCATLLLKKQVPAKLVAELLGHTSIQMTLDTYSHVLPGMQEVRVRAMEEMFG
jgi:integrase